MTAKIDKITKARTNLVLAHPFFAALALRLKLVEAPYIPTAATDGQCIYYNAEFIEGLTISQITGLLAHEVMHPAMLHHTRRGGREHGKWNHACDYAINPILVDAGLDLPEKGLLNPAYAGMCAEEIYNLLPEGDYSQPDPNGMVMDAGSGQGNGSPGKDGQPPPPPPSGSEIQGMEADWKSALAQAATMAKQAGRLPASMERLIDSVMESKLPWRQLLQAFFNDPQPADVTWKRPNRRYVFQGLYLPSREMTNSGEIVVCIDTSGSIGEKELNEFGGEIQAIVHQIKPTKTTVIYCDAAVAHVDEFLQGEELSFAAHGGGGTDFRPPFKYLEKEGITPKAFVYLTDGYGEFPGEQPFPVLWCINNNHVVPPNGQHIVLEVD